MRLTTLQVRSWPCQHIDTLDGPVHVYRYTSPSGDERYTFQRPPHPESAHTYRTSAAAKAAATFWAVKR